MVNDIFDALKGDSVARKISYFLVWRNVKGGQCAPYPGELSASNFVEMYNDSFAIFADKLHNMYSLSTSLPVEYAGENQNGITIFPNPSKDLIYLRVNNNEPVNKVEIFNLNGQLLISKVINYNIQTTDINLNGLKKGMYLIKATNKKSVFLSKIIKI